MIDRLPDYIRIVKQKGISLEDPSTNLEVKESEIMTQITLCVSRGNKILSQIRNQVEILQSIKDSFVNAYGSKEEALKKEVEDSNHSLSVLRKQGKEVADKLKELSDDHKGEYGENFETRIIANLSGAYIKNFEVEVSKSQSLQSDIRKIIQQKLIRGAEIILNKDLNDDERAEILQDESKVTQLMENKLTQGQAHIELQNKLRDIQERHKDIVMLENVRPLI